LRRLIAAAVAVVAAISVGAASAQSDRSERAIGVFADTCGAFVDQPAKLRAHLAKSYLRLPYDAEQRLLAGQKGQIWRTPESARSYGVFSYDDGACEVMADDIEVEPMRQAFRAMVTKLARDSSASITTAKDEVQSQSDGKTWSLLYTIARPQTRPANYLLLIQQTPQGELRMRMAVTAGQR
jgi:hypothetical protein